MRRQGACALAQAATLADTLDGLGAGLFLVDATGRIVHANLSGHAMYHLTPSEARVLLGIVEVGGVPETALI
jgi:PAS domain-containing protein